MRRWTWLLATLATLLSHAAFAQSCPTTVSRCTAPTYYGLNVGINGPATNGVLTGPDGVQWNSSGLSSPNIVGTVAGGATYINPIVSTGLVVAVGGTVAQSLASIAGYAVDARAFGAACDGVTDDSTALQAWLTYGALGHALKIPDSACLFKTPLTAANPTAITIIGIGQQSSLLYAGTSTTADMIALGTPSSTITQNMLLANFRIWSSTTMTGGFALHIGAANSTVLSGVYFDGAASGNGNLWGGLWCDQCTETTQSLGGAYVGGDGVRINGTSGPEAEYKLNGVRIRGHGSSSVGVHIAGSFGGFSCNSYTSIDLANVNFLIDTSITGVGNREIFLNPGCILDSAQTDNMQVNDTGPVSGGGGTITLLGWNSGATRYGVNVIAWHNGWITFSDGPFTTAGNDNIRISDNTAEYIFGAAKITNSGGWGVNCTVSIPTGQLNAQPGGTFTSNTSGNWASNCHPVTFIPGTITVGQAGPGWGGLIAGQIFQTSDGYNGFGLARNVANAQALLFGVNQASLYSEIQATENGVATDALMLNRQGGAVGIATSVVPTSGIVIGQQLSPVSDNTIALGTTSLRWSGISTLNLGVDGNITLGQNSTAYAGTIGFTNSNGPAIQFYGSGTGGAGELAFLTAGSVRTTLSAAGVWGGMDISGLTLTGTVNAVTATNDGMTTLIRQRSPLSGGTQVYVATSGNGGSNSNDCLAATVTGGHGPCADMQHVYNLLASSYDFNTGAPTINIGAGTFDMVLNATGVAVGAASGGGGQGDGALIIISGAGSGSTTINPSTHCGTYGHTFTVSAGMVIELTGLFAENSCSGGGSYAVGFSQNFGQIQIGSDVIIGTSNWAGLHAEHGGLIEVSHSMTFNGGNPAGAINIIANGMFEVDPVGLTLTFSGSYSICVIYDGPAGEIDLNGQTITNTATGVRAWIQGGKLSTGVFGATPSATYLPGNGAIIKSGNGEYLQDPTATVSAATGLGSGNATVIGLSNSTSGRVVLSPTGSPSNNGQVQVSTSIFHEFSNSAGSPPGNPLMQCVANLSQSGTDAAWQAGANLNIFTSASGVNTIISINWVNSATNLSAGSTYSISYFCP